jgi:hypothetical protein
MSPQADFVVANGTGAAVRSDINNQLAAIVSNSSGATEPATMYAYQWWADTTTGLLKIRNAANNGWVTVGTLASANLGLLASAGTLTAALGSASTPGITFTGDTNTGIYSPGADQVAVATSGTGRLFVDASGNVGLGTATFADNNALLHVSKDASGSTGGSIVIRNGAANASGNMAELVFKTSLGFTNGYNSAKIAAIQPSASETSDLAFYTYGSGTGSERVRITAAGLVGIGTTSPAGALDVGAVSGAVTTGDLTVTTGSTTAKVTIGRLSSTASDNTAFRIRDRVDRDVLTVDVGNFIYSQSGSERARIDSSGRLLVGTSSARSNFFNSSTYTPQLQIEGSGNTGQTMATLISSHATLGSYFVLAKQNSGAVGGNTSVSNGTEIGVISFQGSDGTEFVEAARIDAVVDGTPGANDMPGRLVFSTTADGASSPTQAMVISRLQDVNITTSTAALNSTGWYGISASGSVGSISISRNGSNVMAFFHTSNANGVAGAPVGTVSISTTATTYATSSDYRLKENVVPLTGAIERLNQLSVRRFNFIADPDKIVDGFIAHEAQEVVPECVTGTKDEVDADGNPVYQGIDQSKLVPLLTAALQEAIAEIASLKDRVAALESA